MINTTILGKSFLMNWPDKSLGDDWSEGGWIGKVIYTHKYIDTGDKEFAVVEDKFGRQYDIAIERLAQDEADAEFEMNEYNRYYGDQD